MVEHDLAMVEIGVRFPLPAPNSSLFYMPITKSAKKALRNSLRKKVFNQKRKNKIVESRKGLNKMINSENPKKANLLEKLAGYFSSLDKAVKGKTIKRNKANRLKSRASLKISKILGEYKPEFKEIKESKKLTKKNSPKRVTKPEAKPKPINQIKKSAEKKSTLAKKNTQKKA